MRKCIHCNNMRDDSEFILRCKKIKMKSKVNRCSDCRLDLMLIHSIHSSIEITFFRPNKGVSPLKPKNPIIFY